MSGRIAYEAYRNHTGGISLVSKQPIPEWDALPGEIKAAWKVAAETVAAVRVDRLVRACMAADHAIGSVMACREGITDTLLQDVRDALRSAIETAYEIQD